jgi:hypothetical protein
MHERRAREASQCRPVRRRQEEQSRHHGDGGNHADQQPHGVFVVGPLRQDVDDGMGDGGKKDKKKGGAYLKPPASRGTRWRRKTSIAI